MTASLLVRLRAVAALPPPLPARGRTPERLRLLYALGREDLQLARLAEAHFDALAILAEAGRTPAAGALYGVWAAEHRAAPLTLTRSKGDALLLSGTKPFCSGAGLVDHALVTVAGDAQQLVDVDLRRHADHLTSDTTAWHTDAFRDTQTATVSFRELPMDASDLVGAGGFYLARAGFWHGALAPAACWAGGAAGLVDWSLTQSRDDAHTLAHLGAMRSAAWAMRQLLGAAALECDAQPDDRGAAHIRALTVRHLVEQQATDILRRLARAFGPHPLAFAADASRRYAELDLYLRQSHAERDLEALGRALRNESLSSASIRRQT